MKQLKRELKLWLITKLFLWILDLIPDDCPELKAWSQIFPHKELLNKLPNE
jgi:hypothetical protein